MLQISEDTRIVAAQDHVSCDLDGEVAILSVDRGVYYGLNEVGARIWQVIQQPARVADVRDAIVEEYDIGSSQCTRDLIALLEQMAGEGLVEIAE